jgi:sulfhydrogenase subunit beta (sulfur reductase)
MPLKVFPQSEVGSLIEHLMGGYEVVGAKRKDGKYVFGQLHAAEECAADYPITILPPKKYFFPQKETLLRYRLKPELEVEPVADNRPRAIFGMHPCDMHATWLMDAIFTSENTDANYMLSRNKALIVGLDCAKPCDEYAFCRSMGTWNASPQGYDLFLTPLEDAFLVDTGSPQGEAVLAAWGAARDAGYDDRAKMRAFQRHKEEVFPTPLQADVRDLPGILGRSWNSLLWDVLGERCLACGTCNMVCPTCYCFDVREEVALSLTEGERYRVWDSCQLEGFAKVGTGENFREARAFRQRHRFYRKEKYLYEKYGRTACVGCGRCARQCLVKINPVEVYNQLKGGE